MVQKPWGGRFAGETAKTVEDFTTSLSFDKRLYRQDIAGSVAHARMLGRQGLFDRCLRARAVGHVAGDRDAVDVDRDLGGGLLVDVENRDLRAGGGERARGGGAQSGCAAGDDGRLSFDFHQGIPFFLRMIFSENRFPLFGIMRVRLR